MFQAPSYALIFPILKFVEKYYNVYRWQNRFVFQINNFVIEISVCDSRSSYIWSYLLVKRIPEWRNFILFYLLILSHYYIWTSWIH